MYLHEWTQWTKTIENNPIRVTYKVEEISELVTNSIKKNLIKRTIHSYNLKNQQKPVARYVKECHSLVKSTQIPRNVVYKVGGFDGRKQGSNCAVDDLYIINEPDRNDRCLVSLSYTRNYDQEPRRYNKTYTNYHNEIFVHVEKGCEIKCRNKLFEYFENQQNNKVCDGKYNEHKIRYEIERLGIYNIPEGNRYILDFVANTQYKDRDVPTGIILTASVWRDVSCYGAVFQKRLIDYV